jgi:hypothetical protein
MNGAGNLSFSAGSQRSSRGARGAASDFGEVPGVLGWGCLRRILAAGIVVTVALCLSWTPIRGLTLGASKPDRRAIEATARLLAGMEEGGGKCAGAAMLAGPRLHGAFAVPDISCRSYQLSSRLPPGPGGHDVRVLASRHWAADEPAWSKRGGCISGVAALQMRLDAVVIYPAERSGGTEAPADPGFGAGPGRDRLRGMSPEPPAPTCIAVGVDGPRPGAGAGIAGRWCGAFGGNGGQVGCGDRASLPGRSPRYHLIWLVCGQCGTEMALLFYDAGDQPLCASCLDGQMELRQ